MPCAEALSALGYIAKVGLRPAHALPMLVTDHPCKWPSTSWRQLQAWAALRDCTSCVAVSGGFSSVKIISTAAAAIQMGLTSLARDIDVRWQLVPQACCGAVSRCAVVSSALAIFS
jgi:hypothetical protein